MAASWSIASIAQSTDNDGYAEGCVRICADDITNKTDMNEKGLVEKLRERLQWDRDNRYA